VSCAFQYPLKQAENLFNALLQSELRCDAYEAKLKRAKKIGSDAIKDQRAAGEGMKHASISDKLIEIAVADWAQNALGLKKPGFFDQVSEAFMVILPWIFC
jgi:hypothetical protein